MKDKKGKPQGRGIDAFSDISLSGMGKYNERNAEAHKLKRIAELDERIRKFAQREKDAEWIKEAAEFCDRETLANKDILSESHEAYRLPLIKAEAEKLEALAAEAAAEAERERLAKIEADGKARLAKIQSENKARMAQMAADAARQAEADRLANEARIAKAKADAEATRLLREKEAEDARLADERRDREEKKRLAKIAADAEEKALLEKIERERAAEKKKRDAQAQREQITELAAKGDELVAMLVSSPRSKFWCGEVERANEEINAYPREALILMKTLPELERIAEEAKALQRGIVLDKKIEKLAAVKKRDSAWAEEVLWCESELSLVGEDSTKSENALYSLIKEARRIKYSEYIAPYEKLVRDLRAMSAKTVTDAHCERYNKLNDQLSSLEFDICEFIDEFEIEWESIRAKILQYLSNKADAERQTKIDRERREREALAEAEREKAKKRAEAEENARRKISEEYRILLQTIESGSFDDSLASFEAYDKKRSSLDFSLSDRIENFENRMVAARLAVDKRNAEIEAAEKHRAEEAKRAKAAAAKKAADEKRRRARLAAIRQNLGTIISVSIVVLLCAACAVGAILLADSRMLFIAAAIFVAVGFSVMLMKPIIFKSVSDMVVTLISRAALFIGAIILVFIPQTRLIGIALGAVLVLSAVELVLDVMISNRMLSAKSWYRSKGDAEAAFYINMVAVACGICASCIGLGFIVGASNFVIGVLIAVGGSAAAYLALAIAVYILTDLQHECYYVFFAVDAALMVLSVVLTFVSRAGVQIALAIGIATAIHILVCAIMSTYAEYDDALMCLLWVTFAVQVIAVILSLLIFLKFWGTKDFVVSPDGELVGVFVHNGEDVLEIPEVIDGVTVTSIADSCFDRISVSGRRSYDKIVLPDTVTSIDDSGLAWCSVPTVVLSENIKTIGDGAFAYSHITELVAPDGVEFDTDKGHYIPAGVTSIGKGAFAESRLAGKLTLPDGITSIKASTFEASAIEEVVANNVKTVEENAFKNAVSLHTVSFGDGLERIGDSAFRNCEKLTEVNLPQSLKYVGDVSFGGCKILAEIDLSMVKEIGAEAFKNSYASINVHLGKNLTRLGDNAFAGAASAVVHYSGTESEWNKVKGNNSPTLK